MKILAPTKALQEAPLHLRNHVGYREIMAALKTTSAALDHAALYEVENVDLYRGRAQALRAVIDYLEPK